MKKFLTFFLALLLALPIYNINITASTSEDDNTISAEYHNPLFTSTSNEIKSNTYSGKTYKTSAVSKSEAIKQVRNYLKKRYTSFTISFINSSIPTNNTVTQMITSACNHTGVPDEGDYLKWHIYYSHGKGKYVKNDGYYTVTITYDVTYFTTAAQENEITNAINKFFDTYNINKLTDYEKAYIIYDYICNKVTYDHDDNMIRFSAYAAMCKNKAVCQGYSSLLYRMLLTAGINNRFIGGLIGGDPNSGHAWNIVGIKQSNGSTLYYKCDSTWDAQARYYYYFLGGSNDDIFSDHVRDPEYTTTAFKATYPMSTNSFDFNIINYTRYLDVDKSDWYYDIINKISDLKLMGDTDKHPKLFEPDINISRGMVAVVLYRIAGAPHVTYRQKFKDVLANQWYSNAITWASGQGIINGYTDGRFGPDDPITREQLVVMLRNYAKALGKNTNTYFYLGSYIDNKNITAYATSAMQWALSKNIMSGVVTNSGTYLNPTKNASRGECAKMFYVFYNLIK